ncbi:hypothetical protein TRAPUB_7802 [Trametes pubescens]|uniref:Uncharacterized protein n=1 Tax=Trametes pubescens TaxID=154538 RepID=A0A1M2V2I3_TRAPU|nr:hypothetical protein TRAPUB_7802 [Trametes pubescens]
MLDSWISSVAPRPTRTRFSDGMVSAEKLEGDNETTRQHAPPPYTPAHTPRSSVAGDAVTVKREKEGVHVPNAPPVFVSKHAAVAADAMRDVDRRETLQAERAAHGVRILDGPGIAAAVNHAYTN